RAIVPAFNNYPAGVTDFDAVANAIINLGPGTAQNLAVNELGSEISPDLLSASRDDVRNQLGGFTQQLAERPAAGGGGPNDPFWLQGVGRFGSTSSDGNAHGFSETTGGIAGGVQRDFGAATLGGSVSYDQNWLSLKGLPQRGNVADTSLGVYGEERFGTLFADLGGLVGFDHASVKRLIAAPGVSRQASGSFDGLSAGVVGLVGDRFALSDGFTLEPHVGLEWNHVEQDGYTEAGAGGANLAVAGESQDAVQSLLGARVSRVFGGGLSGDASLDWAHDFDDLTPRAAQSFAGVAGTGFTIVGVNPGRDAAVLHAGLNYRTSRITFYARYDGSFSNRADDNAVTGGLKIAF
ncbi:MAG TPA: autotransporter outer membrane beta-barrel domain-containing protein, partial [Caulobacteraceae bacterium]|nr:autotransporter outer membrane beta-barrel domain-containing protein [Caulobacteraceae bacterium]